MGAPEALVQELLDYTTRLAFREDAHTLYGSFEER